MDNNGVIYILTNPSFPKYVKIGYADNVYRRLEILNRSECIPFAFRLYAYYKVKVRLTDMKLHQMIDQLNPNLRSIENYNGKTRKREFYAMTKEQAYKILETIAEINGLKDNLVLIEPTEDEIRNEEIAYEIENKPFEISDYLINKNDYLIMLHQKLFEILKSRRSDIYEVATPNYLALRNAKGKNIAEIHLYKSKILIVTRVPNNSDLKIGEAVPDTYLWTLNYKIYFDSEKELELVSNAILDVYDQIK